MKLLETLLALLFADVRIDNVVLIVLVIVVKVDVVVVVTLSIGCQHDVVIHPHWAWRGSYNRRAGSRATGGNTCRAGSTAGSNTGDRESRRKPSGGLPPAARVFEADARKKRINL